MKPARPGDAGGIGRGIRDAFAEFLLVPTLMITAFLAMAAGMHALDRNEDVQWLAPLRESLREHVVADAEASRSLLETIAAGVITITSITVSLLLIALQQSATALTHQVYDQFLRNWRNQAYFGWFVGLSLYALLSLALAGPHNPVISASLALVLTVAALYLMLVLFYTTVDQMRPGVVMEAIHHHALVAREAQRDLLERTRRTPRLESPARVAVRAEGHGFIVGVDLDKLAAAVRRAVEAVEVVLKVRVGSYVVVGQVLAEVRARNEADGANVAAAVEAALERDTKRDIGFDPLDAVEELETIGWTAISTAQSDADAGRLTIYCLRDLLARWAREGVIQPKTGALPVVYPDAALDKLLDAFESLAVAASESMQHQSLAEVLRTFEITFDALPAHARQRIEDILLRSLSALGDHVLTADLEDALTALIAILARDGRRTTAAAASTALEALGRSLGRLGGRATRASRG